MLSELERQADRIIDGDTQEWQSVVEFAQQVKELISMLQSKEESGS